jgi:hypothetical protein
VIILLLIDPSKVSKSLLVITITLMLCPNSSCITLVQIQTANMDHSWFISFDQEHFGGILPLWFARWWSHFSLIPNVLPLGLIESFELFKTCFKTDSYGSKFPHILHFVKQFRLPWILRWQYVILEDKLERHWYVKW